jgi:hypothetical protein
VCIDPARPFCDVDGAFGPLKYHCIAVDCQPEEFVGCRGDSEIVCNSTGANYAITNCEKGCSEISGGCRGCSNSAQCYNPTPICDSNTYGCRECVFDEECPSNVCDDGTCVSETNVVYAAPGGSETSICTQLQPCSVLRTVSVATTAVIPPVIRLLPGLYADQLAIAKATSMPLEVVATGASITSFSSVLITNGANVVIRNLTVSGFNEAIRCGDADAPLSSLRIKDSVVVASGIFATRCALRMEASELRTANITNATAIALGSDALFEGDRLHIHGGQMSHLGSIFSERVSFKLTNSLLENVIPLWSTNDTAAPGSKFLFGFNTIILNMQGNQIDCRPNSGSPNRLVLYENNIIVARGASSVLDGAACVLVNNVLMPYPSPPSGNIVAEPQFVDEASGNFRLKDTSPAVDAATPSEVLSTGHDFEGGSRPQAGRHDVGAFELRP